MVRRQALQSVQGPRPDHAPCPSQPHGSIPQPEKAPRWTVLHITQQSASSRSLAQCEPSRDTQQSQPATRKLRAHHPVLPIVATPSAPGRSAADPNARDSDQGGEPALPTARLALAIARLESPLAPPAHAPQVLRASTRREFAPGAGRPRTKPGASNRL